MRQDNVAKAHASLPILPAAGSEQAAIVSVADLAVSVATRIVLDAATWLCGGTALHRVPADNPMRRIEAKLLIYFNESCPSFKQAACFVYFVYVCWIYPPNKEVHNCLPFCDVCVWKYELRFNSFKDLQRWETQVFVQIFSISGHLHSKLGFT